MSRTKKGKPGVGKEYWGKRPVSRNHGAIPGKFSKKRTHRLERLEAKEEIRILSKAFCELNAYAVRLEKLSPRENIERAIRLTNRFMKRHRCCE